MNLSVPCNIWLVVSERSRNSKLVLNFGIIFSVCYMGRGCKVEPAAEGWNPLCKNSVKRQ